MSKPFKRIIVGKSGYLYYDTIAIDPNAGQLVFLSLVDNAIELKKIQTEVNRTNSIFLEEAKQYVSTSGSKFDTDLRKQSNSEFAHLVVNRKDSVETLAEEQELLTAYVYSVDNSDLEARIYDKLYSNTAIPLLEGWMPYIHEQMIAQQYLRPLRVYSVHDIKPFFLYKLRISKDQLLSIVQVGLRSKAININNTDTCSELMEFTDGLDSYLNIFGDILAQRIQQSFEPKFDPKIEEYSEYVNNYDDSCYHAGIDLYNAQKATIQSAVNNLNVNNVTYVVGEMGCGKTAIGAGIAYSHYGKKSGMTNVVMCPSHLVEKWKREVEKLVPNGKGYIINDIKDLISIERKIKNKYKLENTFLIISKEAAKFSYEMRPCTVWSRRKNTFVCPCCGQALTKRERIFGEMHDVDFDKLDMLKPLAMNAKCENRTYKYNSTLGINELVDCNTSLWAPLNKYDTNTGWIKLGKSGWIMQKHIDVLFDEFANKSALTRKEGELFAKIVEAKNTLDDGENLRKYSAPRKYSIAKYIRERFKGHIDYALIDELHLYKGNSLQGQAMADLTSASKHFIGLTGTLLNGYASGLFYILYRTLPKLMKSEGFQYESEGEFMRQYGVVQRTNKFNVTNGRKGDKVGMSSEKQLPGVSPLLFTNFLLENSAFVSLSDMDGGLPGYEEIPIPIRMDDELKQAYDTLETELRHACSFRGAGGMKAMGSLLQALSVYPDQCYNQPEVLHPDTNEVLVIPPQLAPGARNKENAILELVQEKIANGEKVLIYYEWTNRTDVAQKLSNMFKENGIKSVNLTSSVKASEREEWIDKQLDKGIDVLLCNPKLVETGLDLLAFTNIVFYQVGYNIFTLRQASRRSWRLSQTEDVRVYFMYYEETIQAQALSLMATKLQASMAIEGKFSEEGLRAMSNNDNLLTQIAKSVVEGIKDTIEINTFNTVERKDREYDLSRLRIPMKQLLINKPIFYPLTTSTSPSFSNLSSHKKAFSNLLNGTIHIGNLL